MSALSTMPALKSLYINLQLESQVDLIMRLLPDLMYLNSLPVDRDALEDEDGTAMQSNDAMEKKINSIAMEA